MVNKWKVTSGCF